jgi:hypothetical protein
MKNAKKTSAKRKQLSKTALIKDLRAMLEMHQYSGHTWELSVIRDTLTYGLYKTYEKVN